MSSDGMGNELMAIRVQLIVRLMIAEALYTQGAPKDVEKAFVIQREVVATLESCADLGVMLFSEEEVVQLGRLGKNIVVLMAKQHVFSPN